MGNGNTDKPAYASNSNTDGNQANKCGRKLQSSSVPAKVFKCRHCSRKFLNPRALGGHQNAHKRERIFSSAATPGQKPLIHEGHAIPHNQGHGIDGMSAARANEGFNGLNELSWGQQIIYGGVADPGFRLPLSFYVHPEDPIDRADTEAAEDGNGGRMMPDGSGQRGVREMELMGSFPAEYIGVSHQPNKSNTCLLDLDLHL